MLRFWRQVQKTEGCWLWMGFRKRRSPHGEFYCSIRKKKVISSRFAWEITNGPIPEGLNACHHCDNPPCVRPDHLFLGTQAENLRDCVLKGRNNTAAKIRRGESNGRSKLAEPQVLEILGRLRAGETRTALAREFGVSITIVSGIGLRKRWLSIVAAEFAQAEAS